MERTSDIIRRVYETIRLNTTGGPRDRIDLDHLMIHLREFDRHEVKEAAHELYLDGLIEADDGRHRPTDPDHRIPHPGEVDA